MRKNIFKVLPLLLLAVTVALMLLNGKIFFSETSSEKEIKSVNILTYNSIPLSTLDGFHTLYPDYEINIERYSKPNYLSFLSARLRQDNSIDIIEIPVEAYGEYADQNVLLPITSMTLFMRIDSTALEYLKKLTGSQVYYGVPYQSNYLGIWYNASLFDKYNLLPPDNLAHFTKALQVFSENDISPLAIGLADNEAANNLMTLLTADTFASCSHSIDISNNFSGIDDSTYFSAFQSCYDMLGKGYLPESCLYMTDEQAFEAFLNSSYAMAISSENSISMISNSSLKQIDLHVCGFFTSEQEQPAVIGVPADSVLSININSSNIDICKLFLDYYTQYDTILTYINDTHRMTTIQNYLVSPTLFNSWYKIKRQKYYVPAEHFYLSPYLCNEELYSLPRQLFYNLITPQEFIDSIQKP